MVYGVTVTVDWPVIADGSRIMLSMSGSSGGFDWALRGDSPVHQDLTDEAISPRISVMNQV